jgi:hypothetical protein
VSDTTTTLELIEAPEEEVKKNSFHGVHVACQKEAEFVTAACGLVLDWGEKNENSDKPPCDECRKAVRCPVCHTFLGFMRF